MTNCPGVHSWPFNSLRKKACGSLAVATRLDEDIDDVAILIDGTPEIVSPSWMVTKTSSRCQMSPCRRLSRRAYAEPNVRRHSRIAS